MKNNAIRNAIQNGGKYHIRIFDMAGDKVKTIQHAWWNTHVYSWPEYIRIGEEHVEHVSIEYKHIMRIEIHAAQFPYKEETPWLYIYLK